MDSILVLDFGGQTTQLIGRRIRDFGVHSEIAPGDSRLSELLHKDLRGIVLSGSPRSVWEDGAFAPDSALLSCGLPVLGICYGFHQLSVLTGGEVQNLPHREYGRAKIRHDNTNPLFKDVPNELQSWMSHGDSVARLGNGWKLLAESENGLIAAARHESQPLFGVQFHPEADHCDYGKKILENFAVLICKAKKEWSVETYLDSVRLELREKAGKRNILTLVSGGVDSLVTAALLLDALPSNQVWLMYIDTGLMRKGETDEVAGILKSLGAKNLLLVDAEVRFLEALEKLEEPEDKRRTIGDVFIKVQRDEIAKHLSDNYLLAQGTLYTDLVESGQGVGEKTHVIKSHHNVGSPLVQAKRIAGELLEPLSHLYKDEVRYLGTLLGLSSSMVNRQPFPGPGLAIRIISEVSREKLDILREADAIFIEELKARGLYEQIWQAFCVLLPIRSVGVTGDSRHYAYVLALRAVVSRDGMTADVFEFPTGDLLEISARITNSVREIGRIVYDVSSKPPATIEWE